MFRSLLGEGLGWVGLGTGRTFEGKDYSRSKGFGVGRMFFRTNFRVVGWKG